MMFVPERNSGSPILDLAATTWSRFDVPHTAPADLKGTL